MINQFGVEKIYTRVKQKYKKTEKAFQNIKIKSWHHNCTISSVA